MISRKLINNAITVDRSTVVTNNISYYITKRQCRW